MKIRKSLFIISLFLFVSCNNFFNDIEPSDNLPVDDVFITAKDLETGLTGVYNSLQSRRLTGGLLSIFSEAIGGNSIPPIGANAEDEQLNNLVFRPSGINVTDLWTEAYKAINLINRILEALETVEDVDLTDDLKARISGEAYFIRGMLYFELVRFYAFPYEKDRATSDLGVPIMLASVLIKEEIQYPSRAFVDEVYLQAELDISKARDSLTLSEQTQQGRANRYAAIAYLARIAFQKHDYENAADYAQKLITESGSTLNDTPQEFFLEGSKEEIWVISNSPSDTDFRLSSLSNGEGAKITDDLIESGFEAIVPEFQLSVIQDAGYQVVDLRVDYNILATHPLITSDTSHINKYEDFQNRADDAPMARLAEFILMRAEALTLMDGINQANIDLLNEVRGRSLRIIDGNGELVEGMESLFKYKATDFQNVEELIAAIVVERRVELCFEGNYFHDLMRRKASVNHHSGELFTYDNPRLRLPIPQVEIDANPNLDQNEGY